MAGFGTMITTITVKKLESNTLKNTEKSNEYCNAVTCNGVTAMVCPCLKGKLDKN